MSVTSEAGRRTTRETPDQAARRRRLARRPRRCRCGVRIDRPLTSYYLLLGGSALLLAIGLVMVLSASSVYSFRVHDSSYDIFLKQLTWVLLGAPGRLARQPDAAPGAADARLAGAPRLGRCCSRSPRPASASTVNGNRNWLALGPITIQPSELAKLAIVLWCADVYAKKEQLLGDWWHALIPVVPVVALISVLVVVQHDLGTALVLFAIVLGMLWVVGVPARLFVGALLAGRRGGVLPRGRPTPSGVRG